MCNGRKRSICSCRRMQWVNVLSHNCWVIDHWGVKKKCIECVAVWNEMNWRGQVQRCTENQKKRTTTTDAVKWKEQTTMLVCVKWIKLNTPEKRKAEETLKWSCCEGIFNYKSNFKSIEFRFISFFVALSCLSSKQKHPPTVKVLVQRNRMMIVSVAVVPTE